MWAFNAGITTSPMYISKSWLEQYIAFPKKIASQDIAKRLTLSTVEVEGVKDLSGSLDHVVVGQVVSVEKHPQADRLNVCSVDVGREKLQIVCGGSNVRVGMKVALGKIGAKVKWHGEGDLVELKPTAIRGVDSAGMICASDEIGLLDMFPKKEEKEILDLSSIVAKPGTALAQALGLNDVVFDIDNKSMTHRPDLWGHYGMAREISALFNLNLKLYKTAPIKQGKTLSVAVTVKEKKLCPRYMAVALDNVKVGPSPAWLQQRLQSVGVRPISNIVDITNYVMLEVGQPMHAFDAEQLATNKEQRTRQIVVRKANNGEKMKTLDGKERVLTGDMLVIANDEKALALAGVMGGEDSGITDATTSIIFEAANFDASSIRRTSTKLGLRSDSSARFEKSLDPMLAKIALEKAVELTLKLSPGARVASKVADVFAVKPKKKTITFVVSFLEKKIGAAIPAAEAKNYLQRLGFGVTTKKDSWSVTVPSFRATKDIAIAEDVAEEVARLHGYNNIKSSLPTFSINPPTSNKLRDLEHRLREILAYECGYTEVYNYSFVTPELIKKLGDSPNSYLELDNPIAKDRPYLRRYLLGGLLENVEQNLHRAESVKLFELGRAYIQEFAGEHVQKGSKETLPAQPVHVSFVVSQEGIEVPFYEASAVCQGLFERLNVSYRLVAGKREASWHPGRSAEIFSGDKKFGIIAELHPSVQEKFGIDTRTAFVEINVGALLAVMNEKTSYTPVATYPSVVRDVAFLTDRTVEHAGIVTAVAKVNPLIRRVELFDVYEGKNIPEGKKSLAYHIEYRSDEKTLEASAVDQLHAQVVSLLQKEFGAEIRT